MATCCQSRSFGVAEGDRVLSSAPNKTALWAVLLFVLNLHFYLWYTARMLASTIIFTLPKDSDWDALRARALIRAKEAYVGLAGLRTKAFILNPDTGEYGGMYIWESQADLDSFLRSDLITAAAEKLGQPVVHTYEIPAYIENHTLL